MPDKTPLPPPREATSVGGRHPAATFRYCGSPLVMSRAGGITEIIAAL